LFLSGCFSGEFLKSCEKRRKTLIFFVFNSFSENSHPFKRLLTFFDLLVF